MITQFLLWLQSFVITDERGQGIIEYALLAVLISIAAIMILRLFGPQVNTFYQNILDVLQGNVG